MKKWNVNLTLERPFGPWVLRGKLPDDILQKMIRITDKITDDAKKISMGPGLAGIIEDEPFIPGEILRAEGVYDFFIDLVKYYGNTSIEMAMKNNDTLKDLINTNYTPDTDHINKQTTPKLKVNLTSMWIVNQKENEYNPAHLHTNATISSVMYLKIPKYKPRNIPGKSNMDGKIEFIHHASGEMWKRFELGTWAHQPEVGDIFMWPADLLHTVYPFLGDGIRRSCSFNAIHEFQYLPTEQIHEQQKNVISMKEARLQTKVDLLEDKLNKLQDKK